MDRFVFRLPDLGEGVAEAEIVAWHVRPGDRLEEDQPLLDLMTDKATVEMTTPVAGAVAAVHGSVGDRVPVGSTLVELDLGGGLRDERADALAAAAVVGATAPDTLRPARTPPSPAPPLVQERKALLPSAAPGRVPLAAPATRRRAHELGIPLQFVPGTGPAGRITPEDLDNHILQRGAAPPGLSREAAAPRTAVHAIRLLGLRRRIAERMELAARRIPHFGYVEEFDLTELEALRRTLNADRAPDRPKLTPLAFFMRAIARVVPSMPEINARYDDESGVLHTHEGVHVGIATQTEAGLLVPVVRHVEARDLHGCARELARVTAAARDGSATLDELTGSTITLTSLGTLGGIAATPIINHPEVAIIGPNRLERRPVIRDGQVVARDVMNVSSSFDHRVVDGFGAARFIAALKRLLEQPALLFIDGA